MSTNYRDFSQSAVARIRRAKNLTASFMVLGAFLLGVNALLSISLMQLAGKTAVSSIVMYDTPQGSYRMAMIDGIGASMLGRDKLIESFVRQYIVTRHTVMNETDMLAVRAGPGGTVHNMSAPRVYLKFAEDTKSIKDDKDIANVGSQTAEVDRPQAEVFILGVKMIEEAEAMNYRREVTGHTSLWEVVFDTVAYNMGTDRSTRDRWKATLVVTTHPAYKQLTTFGLDQFIPINPLGLAVAEYNEARVLIR